MAREVYRFSVTIPAGTAIATPQVSQLRIPDREVTRVEVVVPPGPRGMVGFRFTSGGLAVEPINAGAWIVTDDERLSWDFTEHLDSGAWELTAYNIGAFNHTLEIRFLTELVGRVGVVPAFQPLSVN